MSEPKAIAYVNWGRWVVECPYGCGNARTEEPGEAVYYCTDESGKSGCHRYADIVWPPNPDRIMAVLSKRPAEKNRGWFPRGHPIAIAWGVPHGQSVDELDAETDGHVDEVVPPEEAQRRELDRLLAEHGMRLAPDGTTLRRL